MVEKQKEKQEETKKILEFGALDSRLRELEQGLMLLEKQIVELQLCQLSLDELKATKKGTEMLAILGPGLFVKASLADNSEVLVDVGAKALCKKSVQEAKEVIGQKLDRAMDVHARLSTEMKSLAQSLIKLEQELKEKQKA